MELKIPIKAKVFEALGAIADQRVELIGPTEARVISSARDKTYLVRWSADRSSFSSTDNATKWQGAIGYPIIAVLLELNVIHFDRHTSAKLAGIPWKELNDRAKRDYDLVVDQVLSTLNVDDRARIVKEVDRIHAELSALKLRKLI